MLGVKKQILRLTGLLTGAPGQRETMSQRRWDAMGEGVCHQPSKPSLFPGTHMERTDPHKLSSVMHAHIHTNSEYKSNMVVHSFNLSPQVAEASRSQGLSPVLG